MAARWERFMADGDRYNLQYRTQKDGKVRPEHAALHGVTLPPSDPFWEEFYPPNGWNCRCTVIQVRKSKYPATPHDEAMRLGDEALQRDKKGMFRFNPGIEGKTVPDYNPYTISKCRSCPIAKGGMNSLAHLAAFIPDSELCKACSIYYKCAAVKEKSAAAIQRMHYLHKMEPLLSKRITKFIDKIDKNVINIQFTEKGNKHLYSDVISRTRRVRLDDLKDLDKWLKYAEPDGDASKNAGHSNKFVHFYYFKVQIRDKWVRFNVGMKERTKGNGQIYKEYTLYAINDIKDKSTKGGS